MAKKLTIKERINIQKFARMGWSSKDISEAMKLNVHTVHKWRKKRE